MESAPLVLYKNAKANVANAANPEQKRIESSLAWSAIVNRLYRRGLKGGGRSRTAGQRDIGAVVILHFSGFL